MQSYRPLRASFSVGIWGVQLTSSASWPTRRYALSRVAAPEPMAGASRAEIGSYPSRSRIPRERPMCPPDRRAHGVQAAVSFPGGVPHERLSVEPEGGNSIAERVYSAGRRGADGLAELPEVLPRSGRQGREVGTHLAP